MDLSPLNHNNKYFSEEEYRFYLDSAREYIASVGTSVIFYKVNKSKSQIDDLYGEGYKEEVYLDEPIEIPGIVKFEEPQNKSYVSDKGLLRYEEYGNLSVSFLLDDLELYKADITYGDYIGYRVSETEVIYFQVANDSQKHFQNKNTFLGYRSYWKKVTCVPTNKGQEFFEL